MENKIQIYKLVKITKEARRMLNIMSANDSVTSQDFLTKLIEEEFNKRNS